MFEKVQAMLAETLHIAPEKITLESNLKDDLNADSLDLVELIATLEDDYNITIPDEDAEKIQTVGDVVAALEKIMK